MGDQLASRNIQREHDVIYISQLLISSADDIGK